MKNLIIFLFCTTVLIAEITTSIPPLKFVVEKLAPKGEKVNSLIRSDQSPHSFSASPSQVMELGKSQLYFHVNMELQQALEPKLKSRFPNVKSIDLSKTLPKATVDFDRHIWLSLDNLLVLAQSITSTLISTYPDKKQEIEDNFSAFKMIIEAKSKEFTKKLKPFANRTFYIYHPTLGHFAKRYKLTQKAIEADGKSPTPRELIKLIRQAKKGQAKILLVQEQFNQKPARIISEKIQGEVKIFNPMAENSLKELESVVNSIISAYK